MVRDIPVVDLSPFTSLDGNKDFQSREAVAQNLAEKLAINGCIGIQGHGLSPEKLQEAFGVSQKLFDLPYEEKMKAPHPDAPVPHRGYSAIGREKGAAKSALESTDQAQKESYSKITDYKESYEIGSEENLEQYNIWLPEDVYPGFRKFTTEFFWEVNKTALAILEALIMSLGLTKEEGTNVRKLVTGHNNQLRLLHYPPVPNDTRTNGISSRLGAHADWSLFTLLFQDNHSGLEFKDRETDDFLSAIPKEGVLYMNIGDMFQRLSNGLYPSALHRVSLPKATEEGTVPARYSIPFFVIARPDEIIQPQPSRVAIDGKQRYEPITTRAYSKKMFETVNVYK